MIAAPWNYLLSVIFVITMMICRIELQQRKPGARLATGEKVYLGQVVMIIAMVVMTWFTWRHPGFLWIQAVIFLLLAVSLVPPLLKAEGSERIDIATHLVLHVAMIWLLVAMPLLLADLTVGGDYRGMGGRVMDRTPLWVDLVNWIFVAASAAGALWWLRRLLTDPSQRLHGTGHLLMAGAMGLMLVLMN